MTPLAPDQLAELRRLWEQSTQSEWGQGLYCPFAVVTSDERHICTAGPSSVGTKADIRFIAAAHNHFEALLAAAEGRSKMSPNLPAPSASDLDRWQELCDKATPGPLVHVRKTNNGHEVRAPLPKMNWSLATEIWPGNGTMLPLAIEPWSRFTPLEYDQMVDANFELFAESRTALPACIAEIRRLREDIERLRLTDEEKDRLLERFDQTDKPLQREMRIDIDKLKELAVRSRVLGTQQAFIEIALEWAESANAAVESLMEDNARLRAETPSMSPQSKAAESSPGKSGSGSV